MKSQKLRLPLALGLASALLAFPTAAHAQPAEDHAPTLAALKALQANAGPGAGVHAGDGSTSWTLSTGTGTVDQSRPIQPDERFRAGSQTKTFVAVAVLKLVEQGAFSLDEPIGGLLPGVVAGNGYDDTAITVRHLLQHTSGIPTNGLPLPQAGPDGTYTLAALVKDGLRFAPAAIPGAAFHYSNTNYEILGLLIEKVTGLPVYEAVTTTVIRPLGLPRTRFPAAGDRAVPEPAVHGYRGARIGGFFFWLDGTVYEPSNFYASGAVISTLKDLTAFYRALIGGEVLTPASLAELERTVEPGAPGVEYGLGITAYALSCGGKAWGHNGAVPGYFTQTLVTKDGRHASVVTNAHLVTNVPNAQMMKVLDTALCESRD
ncbi:serine hydrolase domain-containing protein [Streptomyces cyaneofuscatus]|uniref:serine hydrolase domain-containing protein n=1 Tax=Streptomyces cyaneofuscatus TaxID=66883 RepID=UPI00345D5068